MNPFVQFGFTTLQRASEHDAEEKIGPVDYSNDPMNYDDLEAYKGKLVSLIDAFGYQGTTESGGLYLTDSAVSVEASPRRT